MLGVDVSKDSLDIYRPDTGEKMKIQNTEVDINGLCKMLKKKNVLVAMEATGGYETLLVKCLAKHGIDAAVLNPRQVRAIATNLPVDDESNISFFAFKRGASDFRDQVFQHQQGLWDDR